MRKSLSKIDLVISFVNELYSKRAGRNESEKQLIENLACTIEHYQKSESQFLDDKKVSPS